jgi:hypothetical protein
MQAAQPCVHADPAKEAGQAGQAAGSAPSKWLFSWLWDLSVSWASPRPSRWVELAVSHPVSGRRPPGADGQRARGTNGVETSRRYPTPLHFGGFPGKHRADLLKAYDG